MVSFLAPRVTAMSLVPIHSVGNGENAEGVARVTEMRKSAFANEKTNPCARRQYPRGSVLKKAC